MNEEDVFLELAKENIELRKALFLLKNQVHKLSNNEARVNTQRPLTQKNNRAIPLSNIKLTKSDIYSPVLSELDQKIYDATDKLLMILHQSNDPILSR